SLPTAKLTQAKGGGEATAVAAAARGPAVSLGKSLGAFPGVIFLPWSKYGRRFFGRWSRLCRVLREALSQLFLPRFYPRRTAGRDRHYWHSGRAVAARGTGGTRSSETLGVHK